MLLPYVIHYNKMPIIYAHKVKYAGNSWPLKYLTANNVKMDHWCYLLLASNTESFLCWKTGKYVRYPIRISTLETSWTI